MTRKRRSIRRIESDTETTDDQEYEQSKGGKTYECRRCSYKSERRFNVRRHERRIHDKRILRKCCGLKLKTKGEWYEHCDEYHPGKRPVSKVLSSVKSKIKNNKRSKTPEYSSNTSASSDISFSPKKRRYSARIRQRAMNGLQKPQQMIDSTDDEDSDEPRDYSLKGLKCLQQENSILEKNEPENFDDSDENSSTITGKNSWDERLDQSLGLEEDIVEYQLGISENMGLEAFIEDIPLNLEPTQQFLQTLENPEDLSGDLLFEQGINSGDDEIVTPGDEPRDDQVALVLQKITQNHIIYDNNNYVSNSTISSLLWNVNDAGNTYSNGNENLENQLPPKKKILKKYRDCSTFDDNADCRAGVDKENERPGINVEGGGDFWSQITLIQRDFLSSIDFDHYKA